MVPPVGESGDDEDEDEDAVVGWSSIETGFGRGEKEGRRCWDFENEVVDDEDDDADVVEGSRRTYGLS